MSSVGVQRLVMRLQVRAIKDLGFESGAFRNPRKHPRTDLFVVVECENIIRPTLAFKQAM